MTGIEQTTGLAASKTGAATTSAASFGGDFETFLTLLTTQLTQQDPLSPMDSDKFTQQLVQYSQVEQSIKTNSQLERMLDTMQTDQMTSALDYVGKSVEIEGSHLNLPDEGGVEFAYELADTAQGVTASLINDAGQTVARLEGSTNEGLNRLFWDGRGDDGARQPSGTYHVAIDAIDSLERGIDSTTRVRGIVDGIERNDDGLSLIVDGIGHPVGNVRTVNALAA